MQGSSSRICKRKQRREGTAANPIRIDDDSHEMVEQETRDNIISDQPKLLFHPTIGYAYDSLVNSIAEEPSINEILAKDTDTIRIEDMPCVIDSMRFIESTAPALVPRLHQVVNSYRQGKTNLRLVTGTIEVLRARAAVIQSGSQHTILPFYDVVNHHVCRQLLRKPPLDRGVLHCQQYTSKMWRWKIEDEDISIRNLVTSSVLYKLTKCSYKFVNKVIISAFVERWHPETNTFHMSFGEMTITLDDVHELLGLPITGKSMGDIPKHDGLLCDWISTLLGIPSTMVQAELTSNNGYKLRTQWLIDLLSKTGKFRIQATDEQVARGYLLMVLGCTLFQDRSGDKVQTKYLHYLVDMHKENVDAWAWGAGCLAYLYRMLGKASMASTKAASGYLTLVEAWVYEHFEKHQPCDPIELKEGMQRTQKWKSQPVHGANDKLKYIRAMLDQSTKDSVIWSPYRKIEEDPNEVVWFHGCLSIDKTREPYHPERVVRQFGRVQDTPNPPIRAIYASRNQTNGYNARFESSATDFDNYINHLVPAAFRGAHATGGECTAGYDTWYKSVAICRLTTEDAPSLKEANNKAVDMLESFVNKGIKKTNKELEDGIRSVIDVLKKGVCGEGAIEHEVGESSKMASERGKRKKVEKPSKDDELTKIKENA